MANILMESFDWLPSGNNTDTALSTAGYFLTISGNNVIVMRGRQAGVFGGFGWGLTSIGNFAFWNCPFRWLQTPREVYVGVRCRIGTGQSFDKAIGFNLRHLPSGQYQLGVRFNEFGVMRIYRGNINGGTLLATSKPRVYRENSWFYLEFHAYIDSTDGFVEVRVNTETVLSVVDVNTRGSAAVDYCDAISFGSFGGGSVAEGHSFIIDDMYVNDTSGSVNNGYLGNVRAVGQAVIANGDHIELSIGGSAPAPTNWQSVLNTGFDDNQFVYSRTPDSPGDYDLYQIAPILNSPLVHAIQVRSSTRMSDATQRAIRHKLKVDSTEYDGSQLFYINQTYMVNGDVWEINPETGVKFTGAEANVVQPGVLVEE